MKRRLFTKDLTKKNIFVLVIVLTCLIISAGCSKPSYSKTNDCEKIPDSFEKVDKSECYAEAALTTKNDRLCEKVGFEHIRNTCYKNLAMITTNSDLCDKMTKYSDSCYFIVALSLRDTTRCKDITNDLVKNRCQEVTKIFSS